MVLTIVLLCPLMLDLPDNTSYIRLSGWAYCILVCTRPSTIGLDSRVARIEWLRKIKALCNVFSRSRLD